MISTKSANTITTLESRRADGSFPAESLALKAPMLNQFVMSQKAHHQRSAGDPGEFFHALGWSAVGSLALHVSLTA